MRINRFRGLNLLDTAEPDELIDAWNVRVERGRLEARVAYGTHVAQEIPAGTPRSLHWSKNLAGFVLVAGDDVYRDTGTSWLHSLLGHDLPEFTTSDVCVFADFAELPGTFYAPAPVPGEDGGWYGAWSAVVTYPAGAIVSHSAALWEANTSTLNDTPGVAAEWDAGPAPFEGTWAPFTSGYTAGDYVTHDGSLYVCSMTGTTEEPSPSATDWDLVEEYVGDWVGGVEFAPNYYDGQIVSFTDGNLYVVDEGAGPISGGGQGDPQYPDVTAGWTLLDPYEAWANPGTSSYSPGDIVVHSGPLYICTGTVTTGEPGVDTDHWELYLPLITSPSADAILARALPPCLVLHPVDGLYAVTELEWTLEGETLRRWYSLHLGFERDSVELIVGRAMCVWGNRVFVANGEIIYGSAPGNPGDFDVDAEDPLAVFNAIRDLDNDDVTALAVGPRTGMVVFKEHSAYRVNDPDDLSYATIDAHTGCPAQRCVASLNDRLVVVNEDGIYVTDGLSELQKASAALEPLFADNAITPLYATAMPNGRALVGVLLDDVYVAFEYDPDTGDLLPLGYPFLNAITDGERTYAIAEDETDDPFVVDVHKGGTLDFGETPIETWAQTGWASTNDGLEARVHRLRLLARGRVSVDLRVDRSPSADLVGEFDASVGGIAAVEDHADFWPRELARVASVRFYDDGVDAPAGRVPKSLRDGQLVPAGSWAVHDLVIDATATELPNR